MKANLFVYGTLCPGRPNEHILKNIGGEFLKASTKGTLHEEGWGATMGYPAIIPNSQGKDVKGYIFSSENLADNWKKLDEFEGEAYQREIINCILSDGSEADAWVYTLNPEHRSAAE